MLSSSNFLRSFFVPKFNEYRSLKAVFQAKIKIIMCKEGN